MSCQGLSEWMKLRIKKAIIIAARQRSCGKVMFSIVTVLLSTQRKFRVRHFCVLYQPSYPLPVQDPTFICIGPQLNITPSTFKIVHFGFHYLVLVHVLSAKQAVGIRLNFFLVVAQNIQLYWFKLIFLQSLMKFAIVYLFHRMNTVHPFHNVDHK